MTYVNNTITNNQAAFSKDSDAGRLSFDDKVLSYIQQSRPQGTLDELLTRLKALSPDKAVTMHQLNKALLYADTMLRNDANFKDYTDSVLDKQSTQLMGVNMFYNQMLYENMNKTDSDN